MSDNPPVFPPRCTVCAEHILKHCVSVNDEFYHPTCLKCAVCARELDKYGPGLVLYHVVATSFLTPLLTCFESLCNLLISTTLGTFVSMVIFGVRITQLMLSSLTPAAFAGQA